MISNKDNDVVNGFGDEWSRFNQTELTKEDLYEMFNGYFKIFPWAKLPKNSVGFDLGCGSGRWAKLVAPQVGLLHCIDASDQALKVAKENLKDIHNCKFHCASVESIPLDDGSADFGYSLGVLHHVPDTLSGIRDCIQKLKKGAPFLLYLYYSFDNKPFWYKLLWKLSDFGRLFICRRPYVMRYIVSQVIALMVYWPLARLGLLFELLGLNIDSFPLSYYRKRSFYVMRTDSLDRFGTRLERRFTKKQIEEMMIQAGLEHILFSHSKPYWCALGFKK